MAKDQHEVTATFRGEKFTCPSPDDWPASVQYSLEQSLVITAIKGLLGDEQFKTFMEMKPEPTLREAGQLLESITSAAGADLGKSGAPSATAESTDQN